MSHEADDTVAILRNQLAAATRILESRDILNYSGHISTRIPGSEDILIQRRNDSRSTLMPDRIVRVSKDGVPLDNQGKPPSELIIHLEILKARPDVNCVLHCHMPSAVRFTLMRDTPLLPLLCHATRWRSGIPVHPTPAHIESKAQGEELARTLGPHNAALMRAHGLVMVAESVPGIVVDAIHFQENAEAQMEVMRAGRQADPLTEQEIDELIKHERRGHHLEKLFGHFLAKARESGVVPADWRLGEPVEPA